MQEGHVLGHTWALLVKQKSLTINHLVDLRLLVLGVEALVGQEQGAHVKKTPRRSFWAYY